MKIKTLAITLTASVILSACAASSSTESNNVSSKPAPAEKKAVVEPRGSKITGSIIPGSKFSKIKLGMTQQQVSAVIGSPSDTRSHETGKRWIPLYYGTDTRRVQSLYAGEGCLTFNAGNRFGGAGNKLIGINVDPSGKCY